MDIYQRRRLGHPVHVHFEEDQILGRDGESTLTAEDIGRKDIYRIGEGAIGTSETGTIDTFYQSVTFLAITPFTVITRFTRITQ